MLQDAELRKVLLDLARRSAGGAAKGGRYDKHDTARLRFIRDKALMGLRLGILVPETDLAMIRLPPKAELRAAGGADWAAMEDWAQRHGRDPRSQKDGALSQDEQHTLLRWFSRNSSRFVETLGAPRGRPKDWKIGDTLPHSAYAQFTIRKLVEHARATNAHLLPQPDSGTPTPARYLMWLTGPDFTWSFPRHLEMYCALKLLDGYPIHDGGLGWHTLTLPERAHARYSEHVTTVMASGEEDFDPYSASAASASAAAPRAAAAADGDDDAGDAEPPWVPLDDVDRRQNGVSKQQHMFFQSVLEEMSEGTRPPYREWKRLDVQADDPTCCPGFNHTTFSELDIDFWSPEAKWSHFGVTTPCLTHGWAHAHRTRLGVWRQRRVKGRCVDRCIAGQRVTCLECKEEHGRLKTLLQAARTQDPSAPRISELEAKLKATPYSYTTLNPKLNLLLFERFSWLAVKLPAVVSHRAAVSMEVMDDIVRAARTAQSSHDLEAQYNEYRSLHAARQRLTFYGLQGVALRMATAAAQGSDGEPPPGVVHYDVGVSTISDNYITDSLLNFYDTHRRYITQWSEQNIRLDVVQADHHGKRFARMSVDGDELLNWRYTVFNSIGQSVIAINVESCSFHDGLLVAAHRNWRANARRLGHEPPKFITCGATAQACSQPRTQATGCRCRSSPA